MTGIVEGLDEVPVRLAPGEGRAESSLQRLRIGGKPFLVLRQRGGFADICYDHGRLLAPEIDRGPLPEIISAPTSCCSSGVSAAMVSRLPGAT